MRNIRKALLLTLCCVLVAACSNSSTDSGIKQGTNTESFAGDYKGTLELELTADAVGYNPHSDSGSVPVDVEVTGDGILRLTIDNYTVNGIIDNDGDWYGCGQDIECNQEFYSQFFIDMENCDNCNNYIE